MSKEVEISGFNVTSRFELCRSALDEPLIDLTRSFNVKVNGYTEGYDINLDEELQTEKIIGTIELTLFRFGDMINIYDHPYLIADGHSQEACDLFECMSEIVDNVEYGGAGNCILISKIKFLRLYNHAGTIKKAIQTILAGLCTGVSGAFIYKDDYYRHVEDYTDINPLGFDVLKNNPYFMYINMENEDFWDRVKSTYKAGFVEKPFTQESQA